ncbi:putative protein tag-278 [Watersipora subatra]|uniref:putative protein tag-278 n=1 Tax=Watersipora subatra TaxID=2589382 RepID=UPI00355C7E25
MGHQKKMSSWVSFPECITIDVLVRETFRIPDPLWPGLGFIITFIVGGVLGALLARMCLHDYMRKKSQDAEVATLIAQGVPMHMRGRKSIFPTPSYSDAEPLKPSEMGSPEKCIVSPRGGATTPSNIAIEADTTSGLSDALIKPTGDSAVAEISHQDVSYFLLLEEQMRTERVEGLLYLVRIHLNKLVVSNKIAEEDAERVVSGLKKKCADIIEHNGSSEKAAIAAVTNDPKMQQNSVAMQTEIDRLHSSAVQKTNWDLSTVESDIPHLLASVDGFSDEDIDGLMKKLKHQLATREHKVNDETRRQVQSLEERLARRRELAEQNRLNKQTTTDLVKAKLEKQKNSLQLLVNNSTITEKEKDEIMEQYEKDLWTVHNNNERGKAANI